MKKEILFEMKSPYRGTFNIQGYWFGEGEKLSFEGMSVPAPWRYREVLAKTMGEDYMTPINRSFGHNYPVYRRYEEKLFEIYKECGQEPPKFLFD